MIQSTFLYRLLYLPVLLLAMTACNAPKSLSHPCDDCRPCEACIQDEHTGVATCQPTSHAIQRCVGSEVVWYNSCDESEETVDTCNDRMICQESDGEASCTCLNLWTGEECEECPEGVDPTSDCTVCLANYDPLTDCQSCIGNRDIETECADCLNNWSGENCDVCPEGFDVASGCAECLNHWRGKDCNECPKNFTIESDCTQCANKWTGENCDICPTGIDKDSNCNTCEAENWTGDECDICPDNFTIESNCTKCANEWLGAACNKCPPRFTVESNCKECTGHFTGENCNICPGKFTIESNCTECINHWEGENCDVCPSKFDEANDCRGCTGNFTGENCDTCTHHWEGENCDVCPDNFDPLLACALCANHWEGLDCDECPDQFTTESNCSVCSNRWEGNNCSICPANFAATNNCDGCAYYWEGDDCDVCPENRDPDTNCRSCANAWSGQFCSICPDNFEAESNCFECANEWTGTDCNTCPEHFSIESNCAECINHWTGDDCDQCPEFFTVESDCADCEENWSGDSCDECANHWAGERCDICPSGFGGENCDQMAAQCIRFVDGDNTSINPTGLSWGTAFDNIQQAINSASASMEADGGTACQVWIRHITKPYYIYNSSASDTLSIPSGIGLYGGFDGSESRLEDRATDPTRTQINCSSEASADIKLDTCITVHNATDVVLDQLYISHGLTGLDIRTADVSLIHSHLDNFYTDKAGAALVVDDGNIIADDLTITATASISGAGVYATASNITAEGLIINSSSAADAGGNMYLAESTFSCTDCQFLFARTTENNARGTSVFAIESNISFNRAIFGAARVLGYYGAGGFIYVEDCEWHMANTEFFSSGIDFPLPSYEGVYIASVNSTGTVINTHTNLRSYPCAKGFFYNAGSSLRIVNSMLNHLSYSETCPDSGLIYSDNPGAQVVQIVNSTIWDIGGSNPVYDTPASTSPTEVSYSIVEDGYPGEGNIDVPYVTGDELELDSDFPGIDAGNGDVAPEFDRDGNPRVDVAGVANTGTGTPNYTDIGAYEYQP